MIMHSAIDAAVRRWFRSRLTVYKAGEETTLRGLIYWWGYSRWFNARIGVKTAFQRLSVRLSWEWRYRLKGPSCTECGTREALVECFIEPRITGKPDEYLCHDHVTQAGYCWSCGLLDWEMHPSGLCEHCADDLDEGDCDDDYPYYYEPSDNGWEPEFDYDFDDDEWD